MLTTTGISPKVKAAAGLVGTLGTLVAIVIARFLPDDPELAGALTGFALAALAAAGAYRGKPGAVVEDVASDELLGDDVNKRLRGDDVNKRLREDGQSVVELAFALLVLVIAIWVLQRVI